MGRVAIEPDLRDKFSKPSFREEITSIRDIAIYHEEVPKVVENVINRDGLYITEYADMFADKDYVPQDCGYVPQKGDEVFLTENGQTLFVRDDYLQAAFVYMQGSEGIKQIHVPENMKLDLLPKKERQLFASQSAGDVYRAVADGADINRMDTQGDSFLLKRLDDKNSAEIFKAALRCGADVEQKHKYNGYSVRDVLNSNPRKFCKHLEILSEFENGEFQVIRNKSILNLFAKKDKAQIKGNQQPQTSAYEIVDVKTNARDAEGKKYSYALKIRDKDGKLQRSVYLSELPKYNSSQER